MEAEVGLSAATADVAQGVLRHLTLFVAAPKRLAFRGCLHQTAEGAKVIKDALPYGIRLAWTAGDVVKALGEPDKKSGGGMALISLEYSRLGIGFDMLCKVWEDATANISQIVLFKPTDPSKGSCGVCKKTAELRCSSCRVVLYCGKNCQTLHWKAGHKGFCSTIKLDD